EDRARLFFFEVHEGPEGGLAFASENRQGLFNHGSIHRQRGRAKGTWMLFPGAGPFNGVTVRHAVERAGGLGEGKRKKRPLLSGLPLQTRSGESCHAFEPLIEVAF